MLFQENKLATVLSTCQRRMREIYQHPTQTTWEPAFENNEVSLIFAQESEVLSIIRHRGAPRRSLSNYRGAPLCLIYSCPAIFEVPLHALALGLLLIELPTPVIFETILQCFHLYIIYHVIWYYSTYMWNSSSNHYDPKPKITTT